MGSVLKQIATVVSLCVFALVVYSPAVIAADQAKLDYVDQVQPILTKHCVGCHNPEDFEGELSLASFADLNKGLVDGPAILPGQPKSSRLFRVIAGLAEPKMPPDDLEGPSKTEIAVIESWIKAGAVGPERSDRDRPKLHVPTIPGRVAADSRPITALAVSPVSKEMVIAQFRQVKLLAPDSNQPQKEWSDFPGKVNAINFSQAGDLIVTASGVVGLYGQVDVFDVSTGENQLSIVGHRDTLYDAELSPDGELLATASYDGKIILWEVASGAPKHTIAGHNGAVFDIEFDPSGSVLASASADETIKLWNVETGERLDTLSQPLGEQYAVEFSPEGKYLVGGGADNRIRVWEFVSRGESKINPLRYTRFAHEGAVTNLQFALDGQVLVSTGEDRVVRLWETQRFATSQILAELPAAIHAASINATGDKVILGLMDGSVSQQEVTAVVSPDDKTEPSASELLEPSDSEVSREVVQHEEHEPNDEPSKAQLIELPATVTGVIMPSSDSADEDLDHYKFPARAGEPWIIEVKAARNESSLDSKVEVLTVASDRIERVLLQATRDSYFTFRGKNSTQSDDYRLHNWRELQLNEYVYSGGEVTKLWYYPRGPDSGFNVYPGKGDRFTYFGTSGVAHALNEPAYIVEPHPPGETLVPTGLPVFPIYFENDDDPMREFGSDSVLEFVAPTDGQYVIKVCDVRGFGGERFTYELAVRRPAPSFEATFKLEDGPICPGSGKEFSVYLKRRDGFEGEVRIDLEGLPAGFQASTPLIVEAEQMRAFGVLNTLSDASQPSSEEVAKIQVVASAMVAGKQVVKSLDWKPELKFSEEPKVYVRVFPTAAISDREKSPEAGEWLEPNQPLELTIAPGQTISAFARVKRKEGFKDRISFGNVGAGRNLPHGVYVDNIGLNGLMIVAGASEREFFITADSSVPETTRMFHLRTEGNGKQSSWPVILHVRK